MTKIKYLNLHKVFMLLVGMYPLPRGTNVVMQTLYNFWKVSIVVSIVCITVQSMMDVVLRDTIVVTEVAANILNTAIFMSGVVRALYYYYKSEEVRHIHEIAKETYVTETEEFADDLDIPKRIKTVQRFDIYWRLNVIITMLIMVIVPPFIATERILPLPAWMPWNWKGDTTLYVLSIIYEALNNFITPIIFSNADLFYMSMAIMTGYQFEILGENYRSSMYTALSKCGVDKKDIELFKASINGFDSEDNIRKSQLNNLINTDLFQNTMLGVFISYVERHQKLLKISDELETFFAPILLPSIGTMTFYTIFMAYCLVSVDDDQSIVFFVQYLFSSILQLYMFSYAGQILTTTTEDIRDKIYEIPWYLLNKDMRLAILTTQMKLLRPVKLTAGFFMIISIRSFLTIMKTCYSFFALLQQSTSSAKK